MTAATAEAAHDTDAWAEVVADAIARAPRLDDDTAERVAALLRGAEE